MKALFSIAFLAGASLVRGGDVQVTLHLIEASHAGMSAVLAEGLPDAGLFLRMREMVKTGEAKVFDTVLARGKEGELVRLQSIREISYLTPYRPAALPPSEQEQKRRQKIREGWKKVERFFPTFPGGWEGSFETRDVGIMFDVSASSLGAAADRWYMTLSEHSGSVPLARARYLNGGMVESRAPVFESAAVGSDLPPADGQWRMLAVFKRPTDGNGPAMDKKVLVFVKVDLLK